MMRLRMFIGLTSALHGLGALTFGFGGLAVLVHGAAQGWHFAAALIFAGLLMLFAAGREWAGAPRRGCSSLSAFILAVTWIAVFFNSVMRGGADTVTLLAPVYVFFGFWAWVGDAAVHRARVLGGAGQ